MLTYQNVKQVDKSCQAITHKQLAKLKLVQDDLTQPFSLKSFSSSMISLLRQISFRGVNLLNPSNSVEELGLFCVLHSVYHQNGFEISMEIA